MIIHVLQAKCYDRQSIFFSPVTQDRSLLSSHHVKVSSKAEAESEHDDFALAKKKKKTEKTLEKSCRALFFFMSLSLIVKFHITEVFCLTLWNETMVGA